MSTEPPIIRPIAWPAILFHIGLIAGVAALIAEAFHVGFALAFVFTAIGHTIVFRVVRRVLSGDHRHGITLFRAKKFAEAAPYFEASYRAFSLHPWLDRFRWLILGSGSSMSYREMALCNAAFCYAQVGDGARAKGLYEQVLREFPENSIATASLNLIRSGQQIDATEKT